MAAAEEGKRNPEHFSFVDSRGICYVPIIADNGEVCCLTQEQFEEHRAIEEVCLEKGLPFAGVYAVTETVRPADPPLTLGSLAGVSRYLGELRRSDEAAQKWERSIASVRAGDVAGFDKMCADDPTFATRVGLESLGTRPIHVAASYEAAFPILTKLLAMPSVVASGGIDAKSASRKTPLDYAVCMVVPRAVEALVRAGCDAASLNPEVVPEYRENSPIPEELLQKIFRIMDLLPLTLKMWDKRWILLRALSRMQAEDSKCAMCTERPPDTVVLPCGHMVVCQDCSAKLKTDPNNRGTCIYCRQPIEGVYLVAEEAMERK
jgi:hypothetical protein